MDRDMGPHVDGFLRGAVASVAGLAAMALFFKAAEAATKALNGHDGPDGPDGLERLDTLDDISLGGLKSREAEPATETVARLGYGAVAGADPDEALRRRMGQAVHLGYGILLGGVYGALRAEAEDGDLPAGLAYGTAAWLLGDELVVPLLGLAEGPTGHPWSSHAKALGAHLAYGAATSTANHALKRVM